MLVELPAKCREAAGVERLEDKAMKFLGGVQGVLSYSPVAD
jgi:hypothetical protein